MRIALPDKRYAIGRIYRDAGIGIYKAIFDHSPTLDDISKSQIWFVTGVFTTAIEDGIWEVIGTISFANDQESWGPPTYIQDFVNPNKFRIYDQGKMRPATAEEIRGLERTAVYKPEQLVDRIMRDFVPPSSKVSDKLTQSERASTPNVRMKKAKGTNSRRR